MTPSMGGSKPVLLDTFCKAGGCTKGYQRAGFYVVGVDVEAQPHYCGDEFIRGDALEYLATADLSRYDAIHASPPCQGYSRSRTLQGNAHPMLIEPVRKLLQATGRHYVIENVKGAPLKPDAIMLVGSMFGLRTMRPRLFECSFPVPFELAPPPGARHAELGMPPKEGEYIHVIGHFSGVEYASRAMGIDWMTQGELAQAIPPAYTEWIGGHLMREIA